MTARDIDLAERGLLRGYCVGLLLAIPFWVALALLVRRWVS